MADPNLDTLRGYWQAAKKGLAQANASSPQVKQLLKGFDQGLGPALDKLQAAGKAKKPADMHKYGQQSIVILKDYLAKLERLPKEAWAVNAGGRAVTKEWAESTIVSLQKTITQLLARVPKA